MFKTHHYLSSNLANACRCYVACLRRQKSGVRSQKEEAGLRPSIYSDSCLLTPDSFSLIPVSFCAVLPQQGHSRWYRVSRIVTLPDYQGVGIGAAFLDSLAGLYREQDYRFSITASHPSVLSHCKRSEHWKAINVQKTGSKHSHGRAVVSFEFR
jgi:GNAT superfamily N-acetyltransferase